MNEGSSSPSARTEIDSLISDYVSRKQGGEAIVLEDYAAAFPELEEELLSILPTVDLLDSGVQQTEDLLGFENIPDKLKQDYEIMRMIGIGGMGIVYEADHLLRSNIALKIMLPEKTDADRRRFIREASIASKLHHPNIVPVFDFGEAEDKLFLSMKRINGPNLYEVLECRNEKTAAGSREASLIAEKLDANWAMVARIGFEVASALAYAHSKGVLHRDIKPANLIFDKNEKVWVTDFGLAKMKLVDSSLTRSNNAVGTLRYMAPEQIDNFCDERTDIYSLGITLYEMTRSLNGRFSFFYSRHPLQRPSEVNPTIPKGLEDAILKACMPEPEDRFQTAAELATELAKFCDRRSSTRKRVLSFASVVQMACVVFLAALVWSGTFETKAPKIEVVNTIRESAINPIDIDVAKHAYDEETGVTLLTTRIAHKNDDAEEWLQGAIYLASSDLELTYDEGTQIVGLYFRFCGIPRHAKIVSAYIQFTCDEADIGETNLKIQCENSEQPQSFRDCCYNISKRKRFDEVVEWSQIEPWNENETGAKQRTPSLVKLVQACVDNDSWTKNSPLVFLISGEGRRCAVSFDESIRTCPKLVVEFKTRSETSLASTTLKTTSE